MASGSTDRISAAVTAPTTAASTEAPIQSNQAPVGRRERTLMTGPGSMLSGLKAAIRQSYGQPSERQRHEAVTKGRGPHAKGLAQRIQRISDERKTDDAG